MQPWSESLYLCLKFFIFYHVIDKSDHKIIAQVAWFHVLLMCLTQTVRLEYVTVLGVWSNLMRTCRLTLPPESLPISPARSRVSSWMRWAQGGLRFEWLPATHRRAQHQDCFSSHKHTSSHSDNDLRDTGGEPQQDPQTEILTSAVSCVADRARFN